MKRKSRVVKGVLASKKLINIGEEVDGGAHYVWHYVGPVIQLVSAKQQLLVVGLCSQMMAIYEISPITFI